MLATALLASPATFAQRQTSPKTAPDKTSTISAAARPATDYLQEPVIYESVHTAMRYENDGTGFRETRVRIRVQSDAGLALAGQLLFTYNSENETVEIRSVRVLKPDGASVTTGHENIQDLSAPVAQLAPMYSDARQKHVTVSGLSVGDTVEYDIVKNLRPLDPGQFWQTYYFESKAICLDEELELSVPKDRPLKMKSPSGVVPEVRVDGDRRVYTWKTSNLSVPKPIEMLQSFKIDVRHMLEGPRPPLPRHVAFSTFQSWAAAGKWYASLESGRREPTPAVRAQADEIVHGKINDTEKAQALYEWVARNIRYVSLSFGIGRYQPHAAADVLKNRYGDCKDKTTLLEAFLAAEGIHATAALMNGSADVDLDVPTPLAFDHVITLASVEGKDIWLDPTVGAMPFGYLLPQLRSENALVAAPVAPAIRRTPKELAIPALYELHVTGAVDNDGKLDAIVKFSTRGDLEVLLRLFNSFLPPAQFSSFVQEAMTMANRSTYGGSTFTHFQLEDADDISKPLQGQFHFIGKVMFVNLQTSSPDSLIESANSALLAKSIEIGWPGKNSSGDAATSQSQPPAGELGGPREYFLNVVVAVPSVKLSGAEKPARNRIVSEVGEYESNTKWEGQTLRAEWRLNLRAANLPLPRQKDYSEFQKNVFHALGEVDTKTEIARGSPTANSPLNSASPYSPLPGAAALYKQGRAEARLGNYANAARSYQSALKIDPKYANAWRELGRSYMYIPDFPDAEAAFRKYLALSPEDRLTYLNMDWVLNDEKKYSEDVDLLQKRVANAPGDGDAHTRLGAVYLALHEPNRAVPELERAIEISPKYQSAQYILGRSYLEARQDAKAAAAFQRAIDIDPTDAILNSASYTLAEHKSSLDVAEKWAAQAINEVEVEANQITLRTQPSRLSVLSLRLAMYWDTMGWVKFQQGDYAAAEKYTFAAWQMRDDSTIGTHLGHIYAAQGKREEAVEMYSEVIHNLPAKHDMSDDEKDASKQLAVLRSGDPMKNSLEARDRLRSIRIVKVDNSAQAQGIAQYLMLIDAASKVIDMEPIGPDSGLANLAESIRATPMPQSFPDATIHKIPRVGTLACVSPSQSCTLTLVSTGSAPSGLPLAPD
ncbi:MAG: DUF3857 domain-containing protein [Candidatus Acidiferrales bacterium]